MKMTPKRTSLALVSAGLLALTIPGLAQAYTMASSMVNMTNFEILGSDGEILDATGANTTTPTGDFAALTFTSTADQTASLTGYTTLSNSGGTAPIDYDPICVGGACNILTNNSFPPLYAPPSTGNYSTADQLENDAPVSGLTDFGSPATVASGTYVGLDTGTVEGSATANNNLNSSFNFVLTQDTGITFSFDADAFLQVAMTADEIFSGDASASYTMDFTITNQDTGLVAWTWAPDLFDNGVKTLSLNAPLLGGSDVEAFYSLVGGSFSSTTPTLTAGTNYQLSARIITVADASRVAVPEPGMLGLLGLGLLGLGLSRRRKAV